MDEKQAPPAAAAAASEPEQPAPPEVAKKLSADELVKKHLEANKELKPEDLPDTYLLVSEHAAKLETWERRALLARFHAHGLHIHSRIHPDVYKAALEEALHGRI
jgi:hypothetical protein